MIQAKNIMQAETPVLGFDATVADAVEAMKAGPSGFLAVKASKDRFQGVLTETAMIQMYLRFQIEPQKEEVIHYRDLFEPLQLIHEDEIFPEVLKKLLTSVGHRVFVINNESEVTGFITIRDVLPYFTTDGGSALQANRNDLMKSDLYLYESFFEKSPFMMHSVNREGIIQMANEMLHSVLGYHYGDLIGKTIFDLYPKEMHHLAEAGLKNILAKGLRPIVKSKMLKEDGNLVEVELASRPLTNQFDNTIGTMTVARPLDMSLLLKS